MKDTYDNALFTGCCTLLLVFFFCAFQCRAQSDYIITLNDERITGEIKGLHRNIVEIKTAYSHENFKIEWDKINQIFCNRHFLISLADGTRVNAYFKSDTTSQKMLILETINGEISVSQAEVVHLEPAEGDFIRRLRGSVSIGYNLAKNNNLRQFSSRVGLEYTTRSWSASASYDAVFSSQDEVSDVRRINSRLNFFYFLGKDYFIMASQEFLQNDEQLLDLRATSKSGLGRFIIDTNRAILGFALGVVWNNEHFTDDTPVRNSGETFVTGILDVFNAGDLNVSTNFTVYPSFTESGRVRADFKLDLKYDLPYHFFVGMGYTHNFDNQPIQGASRNDYVFQTSLGWKL